MKHSITPLRPEALPPGRSALPLVLALATALFAGAIGGFLMRSVLPGEEVVVEQRIVVPATVPYWATRLLFDKFPIKGAAHITGGGMTGNLPRVLPPGCRAVIERQSWPVPVVFGMIQKIGAIAQDEMDRTFNNGLGMILVIGKSRAEAVRQAITKMGEKSYVIGEIEKGTRGAVIRA